MFQKVMHKGGKSEINDIKRFHDAKDLEISVGNSYSEDQLMHTFLDNFHKGGKDSGQIAIHKAELSREETFVDQKSLYISDLKIDNFNLDNSVRNNEGANFFQSRCIHCRGSHPTEKCFKQQRKDKGHNKPPFNSCKYNNKRTRHNSRKPNMCLRCGSEYHFIANFLKLDTLDRKIQWNTEKPKKCAYSLTKIYKMSENSKYQSEAQKIYASMARMSSNVEIPRRYFGDSLQLNNCILDSGATCHMTPDISDFIPGSLVEKDKYIEVADGHFVTSKQTREVQIKMRDNN